jgi:hypothetical protein
LPRYACVCGPVRARQVGRPRAQRVPPPRRPAGGAQQGLGSLHFLGRLQHFQLACQAKRPTMASHPSVAGAVPDPPLPRCVVCCGVPAHPKLLATCRHSACAACVDKLVSRSELAGPGPMCFANPVQVRARTFSDVGGALPGSQLPRHASLAAVVAHVSFTVRLCLLRCLCRRTLYIVLSSPCLVCLNGPATIHRQLTGAAAAPF